MSKSLQQPTHLGWQVLCYKLITNPFKAWGLAILLLWLLAKIPLFAAKPLLMVGLFLVVVEAHTLLNYAIFTIQLTDTALIIKDGWLNRQEHHLPFAKIQSIQQSHPFWLGWLGLTHAKIETAAHGDGSDVELSVVKATLITTLQAHITAKTAVLTENSSRQTTPQKPTFVLASRELVIYTLTSAAGYAALGLAWTAYDRLSDFFETGLKSFVVHLSFVGGGIILLLFLVASYLNMWQRYANFTLTKDGNHLTTTAGLATKNHISVPLNRIQGIILAANWLRVWCQRVSVKAVLSSEVKADNEDAGRVTLMPLIERSHALATLQAFVPMAATLPKLQPLSARGKIAQFRYTGLWGLALCGGLFALGTRVLPSWVAALGAGSLLVVIILRGLLRIFSTQYGYAASHLFIKRAGFGGQTTAIITPGKIQSTTIHQSIWMARRQLAHLELTLREGDDAWTIKIKYMDEAQAKKITHWVKQYNM